jgi:hypothetical protein
MLSQIKVLRDRYIKEVGYPMPIINLTPEQYKELQEDLRNCATGRCATHTPNEVMGTEIRVVA